MIDIHEREQSSMSITPMIMPRYLSIRTYEASEVHETEDDNMSITRSIRVAQTDNRVLKANCYVDYSFYSQYSYPRAKSK